MPARQRAGRLAVQFDDAVWREAIRGFGGRPLQIAVSARNETEQHGVAFADLLPCQAVGPDATELAGCAKLYLPIIDAPPSQRPFAFVLQLARDGNSAWSGSSSPSGTATGRRAYGAPTNAPTDNYTAASRPDSTAATGNRPTQHWCSRGLSLLLVPRSDDVSRRGRAPDCSERSLPRGPS